MIGAWLSDRRVADEGSVRPLSLRESTEWTLDDGVLAHRTGGFFSVCGIQVSVEGSVFDGRSFPMIDQPEVGLLGFVVATGGDGTRWLVQAKAEPGSVDWVQAAPTVQATRSNYMQRHGGARTLFLDLFPMRDRGTPVGRLNSEQGNRFLNKFNCNAIVVVPDVFDPADPDWTWCEEADVRKALAEDFTINTDARSVIATGDWTLLRRKGPLFAGPTWAGPHFATLREALAESCAGGPPDDDRRKALLGALKSAPAAEMRLKRVPLGSLPGWLLDADGLRREDDPAFGGGVRMFAVAAPRREVKAWDQPFMVPAREERACLVLAHRDGRLEAALRPVAEPGFLGRSEFGPTCQSDGDQTETIRMVVEDPSLTPLLSVRQSDEGGRFMRSIMRYDVVLVDESAAARLGQDVTWFSMSDLAWLCRTPALTTNEARSAVSVLLSLA